MENESRNCNKMLMYAIILMYNPNYQNVCKYHCMHECCSQVKTPMMTKERWLRVCSKDKMAIKFRSHSALRSVFLNIPCGPLILMSLSVFSAFQVRPFG